MFKDGLINVHRGSTILSWLDSDLWAIYHRDYKNIGVTIHMVDSELDTGEILYQENILMHKGMKTHQLRYYTTKIATDLIYKSILDYFSSGSNLIRRKNEIILFIYAIGFEKNSKQEI